MKTNRNILPCRLRVPIVTALIILGLGISAQAAQVTATWTGSGDGVNWNDPANWSTANFPDNGVPVGTTYNVVIDGNSGATANVLLNVIVTIDALTVNSGDSLSFNNSQQITVVNSGADTGTIVNNGIIALNSLGTSTDLVVGGAVTLSGSGTLTLGNNINNRIFGVLGTDRLTNGANHTIQGAGQIGVNFMAFTNEGTIVANQSNILIIDPSGSGAINSGTFRATAGGTLRLQEGAFTNTGATINAQDASEVELSGATLNGGTLTTAGSGVVRNLGVSTLSTLTNAGNLAANNGTDTNLLGTITNNGDIALNSGGTSTDLIINGNVTLTGSGTVTLGNNINNRIFGLAASDRLTNAADHTIQGAGQIGVDFMALTNQGTIIANVSNRLTVDPAAGGAINSGTLRATSGGNLRLQDGAFTNTGATINAQDASEVELSGATLNGGTLTTAGSGVVRNIGVSTLITLTNSGSFEANNSTNTNLVGTITNNGNIALSSGGTSTDLIVNGDVTLSGSGAVTLGNNINNRIFGLAATDRLTNAANHTIQGAGQIGVDFMALTNQGTIIANQSNNLTINVSDSDGFTNEGSVQINGARTIALGASDNFSQTDGLTQVDGTLTMSGGLVNIEGGTLAGIGLINGNVTSAGVVSPGTSPGLLTIAGDYIQAAGGTLFIEIGGATPGGGYDRLVVNGTATLDGTLSVDLLDGYMPAVGTDFQVLLYASGSGSLALNVLDPIKGDFTQATSATQVTLTAQLPTLPDPLALNLSTRAQVGLGDDVLIGGLIVTGTEPKAVLLRAIGPSLGSFGIANPLVDPILELHYAGDTVVITNDDWRTTQEAAILATGIPPGNDQESAILATLDPGSYTAVVRGSAAGTEIGLVEIYDLDQAADSKLGNISTRGLVETSENVLIGGLIIGPEEASDASVLIRALGPSLTDFGVPNVLADPLLQIFNGDGDLMFSNDNWKATQQAAIEATGLAPNDDLESAILATLSAGSYTAIMSGVDGTTGIGLVEVYQLD